jgi:cytochrome c553
MNLRRLLTRISVGCLLSGTALVSCVVNAEEAAKKLPADQVEFFETRVRPVLVEKCISCHGDKKQQASLRLDSIPSMVKGRSFPANRPTAV